MNKIIGAPTFFLYQNFISLNINNQESLLFNLEDYTEKHNEVQSLNLRQIYQEQPQPLQQNFLTQNFDLIQEREHE